MGGQRGHRQPHGHPSTSREQLGSVTCCVVVVGAVTSNNVGHPRRMPAGGAGEPSVWWDHTERREGCREHPKPEPPDPSTFCCSPSPGSRGKKLRHIINLCFAPLDHQTLPPLPSPDLWMEVSVHGEHGCRLSRGEAQPPPITGHSPVPSPPPLTRETRVLRGEGSGRSTSSSRASGTCSRRAEDSPSVLALVVAHGGAPAPVPSDATSMTQHWKLPWLFRRVVAGKKKCKLLLKSDV